MSVALSGSDTISINNTPIVDLADGNCVELLFPNDIANVKTGKNGNAIYGDNQSGRQSEVKMRVLRASDSDKFLNSLLALQLLNFAAFTLMIGQFIKKIGTSTGVSSDIYVMSGGIFVKIPEGKSNTEGETDQSVAMYTIRCALSPRVIR